MSFKLGNTDIEKVYLGNQQIEKIYKGNTLVFDIVPEVSNIVLNGTYDDSSDLTVPATWTIGSGVAHYTRTGSDFFIHNTSENIVQGDTLRFTFDISNATLSGARLQFHLGSGSGETIQPFTLYSNGTHTFDYTITGLSDNGTVFNLRGSSSGGGGEFDLDNLTIEKI